MIFAPVQYALDCGAYPNKPKGSWYSHGYQMIGMYKGDWDGTGGEFRKQAKQRVTKNSKNDDKQISVQQMISVDA